MVWLAWQRQRAILLKLLWVRDLCATTEAQLKDGGSDESGDDGVGDEEMTLRDAEEGVIQNVGICMGGLLKAALWKCGRRMGWRGRNQMSQRDGAGKGRRVTVGAKICGRQTGACTQTQHYMFENELVRREGLSFTD